MENKGQSCLNEKEFIKQFTSSLLKTWNKNMDALTIKPMDWTDFHPLFSEEWLEWFNEIIEKKEKQKISAKELAELMPAGALRVHLYRTIADTKIANKGIKERKKIFSFFRELIQEKFIEDYFSFSGKMIIHSKEELDELIKTLNFQKASPEIARILGKIYSAGYMLASGLWTDFYIDNSVLTSGPYGLSKTFGKNHALVIKKLFNLKPKELWETKETKWNEIEIFSIYKNVKFTTDYYSCHTIYDGDPIKNLKFFAVKANGKQVTEIKELEKIAENFEEIAPIQWKKLTSLELEELKLKCLNLRCNIFKPLRKKLGLDWFPSKKLINAVKNKPLASNQWNIPSNKKEQNSFWKKVLDPFTEIKMLKD